MKFYVIITRDGRKIWWTQRDKSGNHYEIERRGLFTYVFIARYGGQTIGVFDTFAAAEKAIKKHLNSPGFGGPAGQARPPHENTKCREHDKEVTQ